MKIKNCMAKRSFNQKKIDKSFYLGIPGCGVSCHLKATIG